MGKVFFDICISLDGYIAGENRGPENPLGSGGVKISHWLFQQKSFLEHLSLSGEGMTGRDNDIVEETFSRIGANIMGKRMFEEGEANWPEKAPFGTPVYVLTHQMREPWVRPGGTTFFFTNESIDSVIEKAKHSAGSKDVRISGGADIIQQYLNAGYVDEFSIHIAPVLLGNGLRLFENLDKDKISVEITDSISSNQVTHIRYKVVKYN
ncbi:MAG TPA: dihydrofolate reductase family protein [Ignavibacteria bacterium]|nr:dihydrofolate reductase family protein [Ignavibacteria bacterium]